MSFQEINVKPKAETIKKLTKYIYQVCSRDVFKFSQNWAKSRLKSNEIFKNHVKTSCVFSQMRNRKIFGEIEDFSR